MNAVPLRFRRSALFLVSGNVVESLVAFGAQVVIARQLVPDDFGRFALTLANGSLVFIFLSLRISTLIIRRTEADLTPAIRQLYFSIFTIEALLGGVLAISLLHWLGRLGILDLCLILTLSASHWVETNRAFFERSMDYRRLVTIEAGSRVLAHGIAVILVLSGVGVAALYLRELAVVVLRAVGLARIGGLIVERFRLPTRGEWKGVLSESRAIWLDGVLENSFQRILVLLAGMVGGDRGAGLFFFAHRLATVPLQILAPISGRLTGNWLSRNEDPTSRRMAFSKILFWLAAISIPAAVFGVVIADPIIPWIFGSNWTGAVPIFVALCGMIVFMALFEAVKSYAYIEGAGVVLISARIGQFATLGIVLGISFASGIDYGLAMGAAVSASAFAAFVIGWPLMRARAAAKEAA